MLSKFTIEYSPTSRPSAETLVHRTDDPIEAEEFLMNVLGTRSSLRSIKHEGVELPPHQRNKMLKVAAERLAAALLSEVLSIDAAEVKHRFGFAA
jgi:hypothetical protein